jgi:hypothetical protein
LHPLQLLGSFSVCFCFLFVSLFRLFFLPLRQEERVKKRDYAPNKETRESQGADSSSDEGIGQRQQEPVSRHIPQRQAVV